MTEVTVKLVLRKNTFLSVLSGKVYYLFQSYQKFKKKDTKTIKNFAKLTKEVSKRE
ncbi:hypothetical protein HMPREF0660_01782 [Prevotella melaninogenica D18]|nr:hypothetical protein HMPREF0660_01782 [Prevotella melaninogenica D18]